MIKDSIQINPKRILELSIIIVFVGSFVLWDHYRVNRDFDALKSLLMKTRNEVLLKEKAFATRFSGNDVTILKGISGKVLNAQQVPTLSVVNYDTKLGKDMIAFTGRGTEPYNIKIHSGDMTLRSLLGLEKHLAVNFTGLVSEGLYPKEGSQ